VNDELILERARRDCWSASCVLTKAISRYASHVAKDSAFPDRDALLEIIAEISNRRQEVMCQTEIIITLRQELKEAKARNTLLLSKIQEHEAREY